MPCVSLCSKLGYDYRTQRQLTNKETKTLFKVTDIETTRKIEEAADADGYSYQAMMESAGRATADRALSILAGIDNPRVTVLVGAGNNGGDGLVAGLLLAQDNDDADVRFYLLKARDDDYMTVAREAGMFIALSDDDGDKRVLRNMVASSDLVIDALFGIGVRLPIRDDAQKILRQANAAINQRRREHPEQLTVTLNAGGQIPQAPPIYVLAVDCPSGLDCDTGDLDKNAIPADETITFITAKRGQFLFEGASAVGKLTVADIGISRRLDPYQAVQTTVADADHVQSCLPTRAPNTHKGTYGRALVVAGSVNYIGAAALSAQAAYRAGAGLVTVGAPNLVIQALAGRLIETTWVLLPHDMGVIAEGAVDVLAKDINQMKSLLIGPGLGTEKTTREFLQALLQRPTQAAKKPAKRKLGFQMATADDSDTAEDDTITLPPMVIDADGLNLLADIESWWTLLPEQTIITPHPGEMARLTDTTTDEIQANRWQMAQDKAREWGCIVMLKGAHTVIAAPDGQLTVLPFKTDALATAGTGDVLAGLIVGLLAQGVAPFDASVAAGYLHGLAGTIAGDKYSTRTVVASDVLAEIGTAYRQIDA
jgi:ADP-dependent NAD(P)H-hydrate dehydratase / NAD(P)H-hydrate epimerase